MKNNQKVYEETTYCACCAQNKTKNPKEGDELCCMYNCSCDCHETEEEIR